MEISLPFAGLAWVFLNITACLHSFIHVFNKHLLRVRNVSGIVWGASNKEKMKEKHGLYH